MAGVISIHFFVVSAGDLAPVLNSGESVIAGVISIHFFVVSAGDLAFVLNSGVSVIAGVISIHFFVVSDRDLAPVLNSGVSARRESTAYTRTHDTLSATAFVAQSAERRTRFTGREFDSHRRPWSCIFRNWSRLSLYTLAKIPLSFTFTSYRM